MPDRNEPAPAEIDHATRTHVPGVTHPIPKPEGGEKQEDVEDRPNVGTVTPDDYPEQQ